MVRATRSQFGSVEDYAEVYGEATKAEQAKDMAELAAFNGSKHRYRLWVISQLPHQGRMREYIVRVDPHPFIGPFDLEWDLPQVGESVEFSLYHQDLDGGLES
jgi:hypothetical protein